MAKMNWEEVSVIVEPDLADEVAGLLGGILSGGIVQERIFEEVFPEELDQIIGPVRVYGYLPADDFSEELRNEITYALDTISGQLEPSYTIIEEQNWVTAWQERYQPIPIGSKLVVVPSWLVNPTPERTAIYIDPDMAFGSGTHPTTQLSLVLLEELLSKVQVSRMIDIGCGSGILSIAAAKLGIPEILGLDIDPGAISISRANAKENHVDQNTVFQKGSIGDFKLDPAPLVVANIIAPVLTRLFEEGLNEIVLPNGKLILSGILEEQLPEMLGILGHHGINLQDQLQQAEWIALIGSRV